MPPPRSTWKQAERDAAALVGGVRTPLSGSNSRHNTQSDAICGNPKRKPKPDPPYLCMLPAWLYLETKRSKAYEKLLKEWDYLRLRASCGYQFELEVLCGDRAFVLWHGTTWAERPNVMRDSPSHVVQVPVRENSATVGLWKDAKQKATKEGREHAVLAFRWHGRKGIFLFTPWTLQQLVIDHTQKVYQTKTLEAK